MSLEDATLILSSILQLFGVMLDFVGNLVNPLDEGSTFMDWIFAVTVVAPVSFVVMRYLVQLAAGYKFRQIKIAFIKERKPKWGQSKSK